MIMEELIGKSVTTLYNGRIYRIDDFDFDKSPKNLIEGGS